MLYVTVDPGHRTLCGGLFLTGQNPKNGQGGPIQMMNLKKGCHALIVALMISVFCNFIAFGDEVAEPAASAVESTMDDTADEAADADSDSEPDGSETEDAPEPEEKKDDDQSSFDSGKKEDHSSFDEWDFQEPEPAPQPEPEKPEPAPTPEPTPVTPEPEKPEVPVTPEPQPEPTPEPEKPEIPVAPVVPEPQPTPEPEKPVAPERWHDDDDDDDDVVVVIPKVPVVTAGTDEVPVIKTFEVSSGDTLPTPEEPVVTTEKASSSELPKTGDSSLPLYAFLASAFGLALLIGSGFIGRHNADETAKEVSVHPQMCCGPQETEKSGKGVSVKAARSSGTKSAPSRFGLRCKSCIAIVLALTHPGWGLFVSKSR